MPEPDDYNESAGSASPPLPHILHTYTHPSYSLLTAASLNLSGEKFSMLWSNFNLMQLYLLLYFWQQVYL